MKDKIHNLLRFATHPAVFSSLRSSGSYNTRYEVRSCRHSPRFYSYIVKPLIIKSWKCDNELHRLLIGTRGEGKDDFIETCDNEFNSEKYYDAFSWISINIECTKCNKKTKEFIYYETMWEKWYNILQHDILGEVMFI